METELRLAGVIKESIVDGPGWRFVVFAQGCPHKCEGCHNPETHDYNGGYATTIGNIITAIKKNPLLKGVTLSGGEPFSQAEGFAVLAKYIHELGLDVITYSGYTFEELFTKQNENNHFFDLLSETDILIDGKFILAERTLSLKFRGSKNQRVIDVKKSIEAGKAIETEL